MGTKTLFDLSRTLLFRGAALLAACVALSCGAGLAAEPVSLVFHEEQGHYLLEGCFMVQADPDTAWQVLSDYDHIPSFVHDMKFSRIEQRWGNDLVLRQEAEGGFLFFTQKVRILLSVHEQPGRSIVFEDSSHQDFYFYQGSWKIQPEAGGFVEVTYTLDADQKFSAPAFLASDAVHGGAQNLLVAVRDRIAQEQEKKSVKIPSQVRLVQR